MGTGKYTYRYNNSSIKKSRKFPKFLFIIFFIFIIFLAIKNLQSRDATIGNNTSTQTIINQQTEALTPPPYDFSDLTYPSEGQSAIGTLAHGPISSSTENEEIAPIASMTKIITALAILKKSPIVEGTTGIVLTLNEQDEQYYHDYVAVQGTITPVTAGYDMTQYEVLQTILLPSSNNMTDSLVDRFFSSKEEYLDYANQMLRDFGLQNTTVADASGFNPGSVSTPSEMIVIGKKALENRVIAEIVAQPQAYVSVAGGIINYNPLITEPGVTGLKPGVTDEAGLCLLFSANTTNKLGEPETVIGVVMGIRDRNVYLGETKALLDQAKTNINNN